jgi:hypothetical protein
MWALDGTLPEAMMQEFRFAVTDLSCSGASFHGALLISTEPPPTTAVGSAVSAAPFWLS